MEILTQSLYHTGCVYTFFIPLLIIYRRYKKEDLYMFQFLKSKKVFIAGCGRFGSLLASELSHEGYDVTMLDIDEQAFLRLPDSYDGFQVTGDACDQDVLEQCGIDQCDIFIATTNSDNINCMIGEIASTIYHIQDVYVRLYDLSKEELLKDTSIKAIYPTRLCLSAFLKLNNHMPVEDKTI